MRRSAAVVFGASVAFAVLTTLAAPSGYGQPAAATAREKGDRAIRARAILRKYCHECHGDKDRKGTIAVSDHAKLVAGGPNPVPFVAPGAPAKSQILQFIEDGSMPPGGRQRPSPDEVAVLKAWVEDSATHFPSAFDDAATLKLLLDDAASRPDDAADIRYLSFAHLARDDAPPHDLAAAERDLFAALRHCGLEQMPVPVDAAGTLYRLDTRQAGWNDRELFIRESQKGVEGVYPITPYDLLLLEYPFAVAQPTADRYLASAKLLRPIPYVRADWVTAVLKKDSQLAADLKSLTALHAAFGKAGPEAKPPCGPMPRAFGQLNPVPAAPKADSPLSILPLGSWYAGDCQPAQPAFTLSAALVDSDDKTLTKLRTGEGFKLRVTTDRATNFALLMVWSNGQVVFQTTQANGYLPAKETLLYPPESVRREFNIADILTNEKEAVEYFVLFATPEVLPKPVIVRSKHASGPGCERAKQFPVYRFFFEPDAKFDPAKVVRKVVPIPVAIPKGG